MTLNITVLTPTAIYQSADYQLSDGGRSVAISTKAVVLQKDDWTGFITYTGIGRVNGRDTSDFIRDWLQQDRPNTFDDVVHCIKKRATGWTAKMPRSYELRHTFIIAAFVSGRPQAVLVSNFQSWPGLMATGAAADFSTSPVIVHKRPQVIVTGLQQAVTRPQRRALQKLAEEHAADPARIRRALAQLNQAASLQFPEMISSDCLVYSQDQYGTGHQEPMGNASANPIMMMSDMDFESIVAPFLKEHFGPGGWTFKGATFGRFNSDATNLALPPCILKVSAISAQYQLVELASSDGRRAVPHSANDAGVVVGQASVVWGGPSCPCFWPTPQDLRWLPHQGGLGGSAVDVNDAGIMVGSSETPDRATHATIWQSDGSPLDIGAPLARNSGAKAINDLGDIVGWASIHATDAGQQHFRGAVWRHANSPVILGDLSDSWSEGAAINNNGTVAIMGHDGHNFRGWTWTENETIELAFPQPELRSFYPQHITPDGTVIGSTIGSSERRGAGAVTSRGEWMHLVEPARGLDAMAANDGLVVAGREETGGYWLPWIKRPTGEELVRLPYFLHHHHQPTKITRGGLIVGTASADYCSHPIMWVPC